MISIPIILYYTACLSTLIPIFFLVRKRYNFTIKLISILGILLFISGFSDFIFYLLYYIFEAKNVIFINNIYTILEFFLLIYIYFLLFKNKKNICYIISVIFVIFFAINTLFFQPFTTLQNWPIVFESIIFVFFSVKYYRQLLNTNSDLILLPSFWINTGIYFYFALDLFLFGITSYMIKNTSQEITDIAWGFHNFNTTVKNILFAAGIYCVSIKQEEYEE